MADTKGNDPTSGTPKPGETKPAAVKPPVLDLKARETGATPGKPDAAKPAAAETKFGTSADTKPGGTDPLKPDVTSGIKSASSQPPPPKPPEPPRSTAPAEPGFPFGATLAGGVLGLAAAYGLALAGYWPSTPAVLPPADPRIGQFATAIPELETVTQTTQSELAALNQRIAALETAEPATVAQTGAPAQPAAPAPEPVDLGPIEAEIAALRARIDAVPAAAETAVDLAPLQAEIADLRSRLDAVPAAPGPDIEGLTGDIAALGTRIDELAARIGTAEASLRTLDTTVTQTSAALAEQPSDIGAVLQLPLILSGLETAFSTGRRFEAELAALRAAAPDVQVPDGLALAATEGLPRPDEIARQFNEVLPAIIAGRPAEPDREWQDGALDWFTSAIALRPTGEQEGGTPEAVTSRLEGAIARRDFAAAQELFALLPAPMQAAAGDVPAMVSGQAEAAQFLQTIRAQALSGEAAQ